MFARLFAQSGLSLDRLRSLLEVGAAGSIARAAGGDPVRQSQYSRQIKELEDFFQTRLVERHGKGVRLTANGGSLARISRFFMLGLSNFQRGCLAEEQMFQIGAGATFNEAFLLPLLANARALEPRARYRIVSLGNDDMERRLHDLTLDFAIVTARTLSRPLQLAPLRTTRLSLWVPKTIHKQPRQALAALKERRLGLVVATREIEVSELPLPLDYRSALACDSFIEARNALDARALGAFLPDFLSPHGRAGDFLRLEIPVRPGQPAAFAYQLAWNPRLLRLNPHATRARDFLKASLTAKASGRGRGIL